MNILFLGNFQGLGWDGSLTDENHIADALEELGHGVTRTQRQASLEFKPDMWDMTLIAQWDGYKQLINLPHPIVYWAFDYQAEGQEWHERLVKEADLYLSKRIADSKYPNWQWLSQDFAPSFLDKYPGNTAKDIDVLFTGSYLDWATERNETIKAVNQNFKLEVYSVNDWPFLERKQPRMDHDLPELYARAKVILSIDHTIEAGYWSDRNAQIMACGGLVVCRYVPLMEARFHQNIIYFNNIKDCIGALKSILNNPYDRPAVQEKLSQGYKFAQENLKAKNRVEDLIIIIVNNFTFK